MLKLISSLPIWQFWPQCGIDSDFSSGVVLADFNDQDNLGFRKILRVGRCQKVLEKYYGAPLTLQKKCGIVEVSIILATT